MSSPLFDLNQNRCILPKYSLQNYSILLDWNHQRKYCPDFQPHNIVPDRFRKAINISRKVVKKSREKIRMSFVKMALKPWLKVGQEWTFRNLHSLMSGLRFFVHDWPKSCEKGCYLPEAIGLTMLVSCRLPYLVHLLFFVVADEEMILLFDFSLSQNNTMWLTFRVTCLGLLSPSKIK